MATPEREAVDGLPAPVARYLRAALKETAPIREVQLSQTGTLRADTKSERWMRFEAEHHVVPPATQFEWNARIRVAPLIHIQVRDALARGRGSSEVRILSVFRMSGRAGTPEMNSGSLHRYLAEAVWYPTALLPGPGLQWDPIDSNSALATLTSEGVTVSLEFRFGNAHEVTGIYTPGRWGTFAGGYQQVPWQGLFRDYREREGILVPTEGEVAWCVDNEWRTVWKGTITRFTVRRD